MRTLRETFTWKGSRRPWWSTRDHRVERAAEKPRWIRDTFAEEELVSHSLEYER